MQPRIIAEPVAARQVGLDPLLDLSMRLGEGTGAVLSLFLLDAAVAVLNQMATFEEAGVSQREGLIIESTTE